MAKIDPHELELKAPKLAAIVAELRHDVVSGKFKPGMRLPTRDELKVRFDTSLTTVQKACAILTHEGFLVSSKTGTTVAKRPPHLTNYGIVVPRGSSALSPFCEAAKEVIESNNCKCVIYDDVDPEHSSGDYRRVLSDMCAQRLAGIIIADWPERLYDDAILKVPDVPKISHIARPGVRTTPRAVCMLRDVHLSIKKAIGWLAEQGATRLAFINHFMPAPVLFNAIRQSAQDFGMQMSDDWTHFVAPEGGKNIITLMMRLPKKQRPDGIFIGDRHLADAVADGLHAAGLRDGIDIHVITYADMPKEAGIPFKRIGWDMRESARTCLDLIDRQRRGEKVPSEITFPPILDHEAK